MTKKQIKVACIVRVSCVEQSYERQVNELTEYCQQKGWQITRIFANKISGAAKIEQRAEVMEMMEYLQSHPLDKVVCLSIDRLGRSLLEAGKIIEKLTQQKISLHIKNQNIDTLNEDGTLNTTGNLLGNILLSIGQFERTIIRERMSSGFKQYKKKHLENPEKYPMGKPKGAIKSADKYKEQYAKEITLLKKGTSLRNISAITGTSINTIRRVKQYA